MTSWWERHRFWGKVAAFLLGVVGGAGGLYLLAHLSNRWTRCPVDGLPIRVGAAECPHCLSRLNWS
jgi:hypothetical protein